MAVRYSISGTIRMISYMLLYLTAVIVTSSVLSILFLGIKIKKWWKSILPG